MRTLSTTLLSLAMVQAIWAQSFETALTTEGHDITIMNECRLSDGGYMLAASDYMDYDFNVVRLTGAGDVQWARKYTPVPGQTIWGVSAMGQFANGDVYMLVNTWGTLGSLRMLLRMDLNGAVVWNKSLQYAYEVADDYSYRSARVHEDANGDLLVSIPSSTDPVVTKLSATGTPIWSKSFTSTEDTLYDKHPTFDCEPTDDGGCIVCGKDRDWPFVMKIDANGNVVWNQTYYQIDTYSHLRNLEILPNGDLLFAGMHGIGMMMRMDPSGTILWMKHYQEVYYFESMEPMSDGTFLLASEGDGSLLHVDADGNVLSSFNGFSSEYTAGLHCISGADGMAHMAGIAYDMQNWVNKNIVCRFQPDAPPSCMYTPSTVTVLDVPAVANTTGVLTMVEQAEPVSVTPVLWEFQAASFVGTSLCGVAEGISESASVDVTIAPTLVEAGAPLNVDLGSLEAANFQWIASNGTLVKTAALTASKGTLATDGMAPGLYMLLTSTPTGVVNTARIVVR